MRSSDREVFEEGVELETARPKLGKPRMYMVVIINDDYTPMDFVVAVIMEFFTMTRERATVIMWQVHTNGSAICGIFSKDVAHTLVTQINNYSRSHQYPLLCKMEPV